MADGVLAPVTVGANCQFFLLDTAATISFFDSSFRSVLGEPRRTVQMATAGDVAQFDLFSAPRAKLGDEPLLGLSEVGCIDFSTFRSGIGSEIYGVIGMDFLRSQIVRIDFDRGELAFLKSVPEGAGVAVPLGFSLGLPTAKLAIEGVGDVTFLIDTGSVGVCTGIIEKALVGACIADGRAVVLRSGHFTSADGKFAETRTARVRGIALGGFRHRDAVFYEASCNALGLAYLSRYLVTFDFPNAKMYLKPSARFSQPHRYDLGGAQLRRFDGKTIVRGVEEHSAAALAGLRADDVLEEIDGRRAESLMLSQVRTAFCIPGKHKLNIARAQQRLNLVLVLDAERNAVPSHTANAPTNRGAVKREALNSANAPRVRRLPPPTTERVSERFK